MDKFKKFAKGIKPIFLFGVILLVILEFTKLRKEISFEEVSNIFYEISIIKIFTMAILGFIAFLPMVFYDILLNNFLKLDRDKGYIIKRSITVNSFNNLIGFGGVINIGLRMRYFGEEKDGKNFLKFLVKSFFFDIAGLSFLAVSSLIFLIFYKSKILINYKIWLLGAILYYPVLFFVSKIRNDGDFSISKKYAIEVSLVSICEWLLAALFFYTIGFFLGVKLNFFVIISAFVIANIIGIASFIPGGLGSFELVILTIFNSLGINGDIVLTWLLLYRIFYYIVPFMFGLVFFIHDLGCIFDEKNDNIPSRVIKSIGLDILSFMLYIAGTFMILSATIPEELSEHYWLSQFSPINANLIYQFPSLIFGACFIILGRANREEVERATKVTLVFLILALIYSFLSGFGIIELIFLILVIFLAFFTRKTPNRKQLVYSFEAITIDTLFFVVISVITIYFVAINYKLRPINYRVFLLIPFEKSFARFSIIFIILVFSIRLLLFYLKGKKIKLGEKMDVDKVLNILSTYECHPESGLALVGDKEIYYYEEDGVATCGISISTYRDRVIVMGEPFGNKRDFDKLLQKFVEEADLYDYKPIFYEVSQDETIMLHDFGFSFIKFGETAALDLQNFNLEGREHKSQRNALSKFNKLGYTFEVVKGPFDDEFLDVLEKISDNWLEGKREKGFSLGYFNRDYFNLCDIAIARDETGKILAFANIMPNPNKTWATIDLMRYDRDNSPSSIMDYLFLQLFLHFKDEGKKYFELGMAPLSNVGINSNSFVEEKFAYLVYKFGYKFYSFEGLRAYKEKFSPTWEPVYLSYPNKTWLLYTMVSIFMVDINAAKNKRNWDLSNIYFWIVQSKNFMI